ncbi:DASS family sodium-coupled anion symporter [Brevibacillus laterosporus]|uniref:DASS family sodium-coupled anion symporter n=1 Tax=Brevibacillus laterosporus TaxID=1465 RepID=UPI0003615589|nr:DASS family sodium-coupled anion symporter [Brevibacillus laterosporus]ATO51792.1 hypothetical protein BrL25_23455 [Brevibacillus laterosporus DSM 25]MBG9774853.1 membrane protein [Brevibacillus laterosporus]MBG9798785.1 membrane protein [Brevibacillus laterosporus]MBG9802220.1 membrane protein [Brevibacillus laterosporus]MCR8936019.1 anion permease [Brevibacillus laterosporus]
MSFSRKNIISLSIALAVLVIILLLPTPENLPLAGQRTLAILAFAVILWVTEAVTYPVSAALIVGLIAVLIGFSPTVEDPNVLYTTKKALTMALAGFSNSAVALVAGALFLAVAMEITGLHKRIALLVLSKVGSKSNNIVLGTILVSIVLALFVPSATARAGAIIPILMGMVAAFGLEKNSRLSALLMITTVQSISIWNIGIKTAAAQNMVALGFMETAFNYHISWGQWFIYAAPWAVIMSVILYFVMTKLIKPELSEIPNGRELIKKQLAELGKLTPKEWRLMIVSLLLLFLWSTEGVLHTLDSTTITLVAVAVLLCPGIGVYTWKQVEQKVGWGTLIVFAVGMSLGNLLLKTEGAQWISKGMFESMGLTVMPVITVIIILTLFNILIHLGFASATSLASAFIPIVIALVTAMEPTFNKPGMVLIQQFVISFGFLLPVSAPQNMLAYGTGSFTTRDFVKSGVPLTIAGFILIIAFSMTYWQWMGLL